MIDRVSSLAERVATGLSRRAFMTRVGLGALAFATFVGELAAHKPPPPPPPPPVSCVLNGGCCGGAYPYQGARVIGGVTHYFCSPDASCSVGYLCASSTCCHGGGSCQGGTTCYSDPNGASCNTLCV